MKRAVFAATAVIVAVWSAGPIGASTAAIDEEVRGLPSLAPLIERITPAVVNISVRGAVAVERNPLLDDPRFRPFVPQRPGTREFEAVGSGVVVDAEAGYVLTNSHVVANADEIGVTLRDGRHPEAKRIGSDPESDVAVIQIPAEGLIALPRGDSDALRVGDYVVAIGNPFGLQNTVTSGIVSAKGRAGLGIEGYEDFIQTDASINPGNSGGALVNLAGELVGINTAIIGPGGGNVGIGFAIPINMAESLMSQLIAHGEIRRGVIGVRIQNLTPDLAEAFGVDSATGAVIASVVSDSPAEVAGLSNGDIIVAVNGAPIRSAAALRGKIGSFAAGDTVEVTLLARWRAAHGRGDAGILDRIRERPCRCAGRAPRRRRVGAEYRRYAGRGCACSGRSAGGHDRSSEPGLCRGIAGTRRDRLGQPESRRHAPRVERRGRVRRGQAFAPRAPRRRRAFRRGRLGGSGHPGSATPL